MPHILLLSIFIYQNNQMLTWVQKNPLFATRGNTQWKKKQKRMPIIGIAKLCDLIVTPAENFYWDNFAKDSQKLIDKLDIFTKIFVNETILFSNLLQLGQFCVFFLLLIREHKLFDRQIITTRNGQRPYKTIKSCVNSFCSNYS